MPRCLRPCWIQCWAVNANPGHVPPFPLFERYQYLSYHWVLSRLPKKKDRWQVSAGATVYCRWCTYLHQFAHTYMYIYILLETHLSILYVILCACTTMSRQERFLGRENPRRISCDTMWWWANFSASTSQVPRTLGPCKAAPVVKNDGLTGWGKLGSGWFNK